MLLSYLKLSIRLLARNPFFTIINAFGLAVGFAVFFILWPFTQSELKADQFIKDHERISRILINWTWTEDGGNSWGHMFIGTSPAAVAPELFNDGHLESFARLLRQEYFDEAYTTGLTPNLVVYVDRDQHTIMHKEENAMCADPGVFEFFDLPFVSGDRKTALVNPGSVVISESKAMKYFGHTDVSSRLIRVNKTSFMVTGVFRDVPHNSHLNFDMVFTNAGQNWWNVNDPTINQWVFQYYKPKDPGDDIAKFLELLKEKLLGAVLIKNPNSKAHFLTQPLTEMAYSDYVDDRFPYRSKFMARILGAVSLTVLLMAWMNYLNLTISRTRTRFKEIGARKMSGALTKDLFVLFICQAMVINTIAVAIAATFIQLLKQPFGDYLKIDASPLAQLDVPTLIFFIVIFTAGVLITSAYAASSALRYTTSQLIRQSRLSQKSFLPSFLTTAQYSTALVLITLMIVFHSQLQFIMSKDLGFDKDGVIVVDGPVVGVEGNGVKNLKTFANRVMSLGVKTAVSGQVSGDPADRYNLLVERVGLPIQRGLDTFGGVDENFIPLYGLKILAGRNFTPNEKPTSVLLSEYATERLGFKTPDDALGSKLAVNLRDSISVEVVGVFSELRMRPLLRSTGSSEDVTGRGEILAVAETVISDFSAEKVSIKVEDGRLQELLPKIEQIYSESFPGNPFTWRFLDDNINRHYRDQEVTRNQVSFFTLLALGVACLGLLGMITNTVVDKTKEMCIRKVIGASHVHVVGLLLSSTVRQVVIAVSIAIPIAWYLATNYISRFTEQIELHWWYYLIPVVIMLGLMLLTIASVVWKAILINPVNALKQE